VTDITNLSLGGIILILRVAVVCLLYLFLWQVLRVVTRDLRSGSAGAAAESNPYGKLVLVSAGQTGLPVGKVFPLNPITIIGRSLESDVLLNDTFLSQKHARLEMRGDEWILEDLKSTNGTFVNGFEVRDPTSVNDGDVIRIGHIELKMTR
jgi:pSer/pThr/pTyr-binding forkhead associated (FHA) protein